MPRRTVMLPLLCVLLPIAVAGCVQEPYDPYADNLRWQREEDARRAEVWERRRAAEEQRRATEERRRQVEAERAERWREEMERRRAWEAEQRAWERGRRREDRHGDAPPAYQGQAPYQDPYRQPYRGYGTAPEQPYQDRSPYAPQPYSYPYSYQGEGGVAPQLPPPRPPPGHWTY